MSQNQLSDDIFKQNYDAYVICSTLNQIVNYIPIKMLEDNDNKVENIINIKVDNKGERKQFNSDNWDKNLTSVLNEDIQYCIKLPRKFDLDIYKGKIERQLENKNINTDTILWNITGGQRSTIIAIKEIVRERYANDYKDVVIYLEGNTNDIIIGTCGQGNEIKYTRYDGKYKIKGLTVEKAMELAGFELYGENKGDKNKNYLHEKAKYIIDKDKDKLLDKFYSVYIDSHEFRLDMIATNKKESGTKKDYRREVGKDAWKKITEVSKYDFMEDVKEGILERYKENPYKFGYLLEFITIKKIKEIINEKIEKNDKLKDYFIDLKHSLKIKNNFDGLDNQNQFCEFDIVLLTRAGQLIIFECKSGGMTGEIAKSRHYTTYAVGGVYGTPIIITPLLSKEINENMDSNDNIEEEKDKKYDNLYEDIYSAIRAAKKANIDVWGIDELDGKLENLFEDVTGEEGD